MDYLTPTLKFLAVWTAIAAMIAPIAGAFCRASASADPPIPMNARVDRAA